MSPINLAPSRQILSDKVCNDIIGACRTFISTFKTQSFERAKVASPRMTLPETNVIPRDALNTAYNFARWLALEITARGCMRIGN